MNVFSIDVEDWYQSSFDHDSDISGVCISNIRYVLEMLDKESIRGTFFVQGLVAERFPHIVKEIHNCGHEIQSHGYSHRPVNRLSRSEFKEELLRTSRCLEDITGVKVNGFRAPDFSIDEGTVWAFEVMCECGITYDSSIFPLRTRRYGIDGFETGYSLIRTPSGVIEEVPVSVLEFDGLAGVRIPVGGGGYFRLLPKWFIKYSLLHFRRKGQPFVIYCHPYEFNPQEWKQISRHVPAHRRIHQGWGRDGFESKIMMLLRTGSFGTMSSLIKLLRPGKQA